MTTQIVPSITDEQLAELERSVNNDLSNPQFQGEARAIVAGIASVITRLRAAEKDAARYRWLRASDWYVGPDTVEPDEGGCRLLGYANENSAAEDLDKAIDTAMEQQT